MLSLGLTKIHFSWKNENWKNRKVKWIYNIAISKWKFIQTMKKLEKQVKIKKNSMKLWWNCNEQLKNVMI